MHMQLSSPSPPSYILLFSICTGLILDLSFHTIVSLPSIRKDTSNVHAKLAHSNYKSIALTRDLMPHATLLPLATFLYPSASSVHDSSKTHPKHLNFDTSSNHTPSTLTSQFNPSSSFSTITLSPSGPPPTHHTEQSHLH